MVELEFRVSQFAITSKKDAETRRREESQGRTEHKHNNNLRFRVEHARRTTKLWLYRVDWAGRCSVVRHVVLHSPSVVKLDFICFYSSSESPPNQEEERVTAWYADLDCYSHE